MKKLVLFLTAFMATVAPAALLDIKVPQQALASPPTWTDRVVPFESAISTTLASYRSGMGLGTEDSPTFTGLTLSGLTDTRVVLAGTAGLLGGDADLTFSGTRLTATDLTVTNFPTFTAGTATRVPFFSTAGLLADSASLTFNSGTGALSATSFVGAAAAGTLSGTTLAANVVTSSLTTVGALNSGSITSGFGAIDVGADSITGGAISGTTGTFSGQVQLGTTQSLSWGGAYGAGIPTISGSVAAGELLFYPTGSTSGATGRFTSTGLNNTVIGATTAATGSFTTLNASGTITNTKATGGLTLNNLSSNTTGVYQQFSTSAGTKGYVGTGDQLISGGAVNDIGLDSVSGDIILATAEVVRARISATGVTVTGTMGATGAITSTGGILSSTVANGVSLLASPGVSSVGLMFNTNSTNRFKLEVPSASADLVAYSSGTTEVARFSSTGLAVTGTLSATTSVSSGSGAAVAGRYNAGFTGSLEGVNLTSTDDASGATFASFRKASGTAIGSINRVTTTDAVVYNTTSDGRLKTNIRDFTGADSGRIIDGLQPRWFDWKPSDLTKTVEEDYDSGEVDANNQPVMKKRPKQRAVTDAARIAKHVTDNQSHVGFVAQEEAAVDPLLARIGAVTVGDDDPDSITKQWQRSDTALVPILVAELKAVRQREAVKDAQITDLLARVTALEARP